MPSLLDNLTSQARAQAQNLASSSAKTVLSAAGMSFPTTNTLTTSLNSKAAVGRVAAWAGDSTGPNWVGSRKVQIAIPDEFSSKASELRSSGFSANQVGSIISAARTNARNLGTSVNSEIDHILASIQAKGWWPGQDQETAVPSSLLPSYTPPAPTPQAQTISPTTIGIGVAAVAAILLLRK